MTGRADRQPAGGRHETRQQAAGDVAVICEQARRRSGRGTPAKAYLVLPEDACEHAGVTLGWFDAWIVAWLAGWEPETCAVIAGRVARAHAAALAGADAALTPDQQRAVGPYPAYPGRLCRGRECSRAWRESA
jgi:hypothetical protein